MLSICSGVSDPRHMKSLDAPDPGYWGTPDLQYIPLLQSVVGEAFPGISWILGGPEGDETLDEYLTTWI